MEKLMLNGTVLKLILTNSVLKLMVLKSKKTIKVMPKNLTVREDSVVVLMTNMFLLNKKKMVMT
jgi:hypothetical protein